MTLHPIPSEFPYISGKFYFLFYQCTEGVTFEIIQELMLYCGVTSGAACDKKFFYEQKHFCSTNESFTGTRYVRKQMRKAT
jgi:hypothetical protein